MANTPSPPPRAVEPTDSEGLLAALVPRDQAERRRAFAALLRGLVAGSVDADAASQ